MGNVRVTEDCHREWQQAGKKQTLQETNKEEDAEIFSDGLERDSRNPEADHGPTEDFSSTDSIGKDSCWDCSHGGREKICDHDQCQLGIGQAERVAHD
jgi:hypothetical protein